MAEVKDNIRPTVNFDDGPLGQARDKVDQSLAIIDLMFTLGAHGGDDGLCEGTMQTTLDHLMHLLSEAKYLICEGGGVNNV